MKRGRAISSECCCRLSVSAASVVSIWRKVPFRRSQRDRSGHGITPLLVTTYHLYSTVPAAQPACKYVSSGHVGHRVPDRPVKAILRRPVRLVTDDATAHRAGIECTMASPSPQPLVARSLPNGARTAVQIRAHAHPLQCRGRHSTIAA